jgi:hypothetical protein
MAMNALASLPTLSPQVVRRTPTATSTPVAARSASVFRGGARLPTALSARRIGRRTRGASVQVMAALADRPTATTIEQLKWMQPAMAEKIRTEVLYHAHTQLSDTPRCDVVSAQ